MDFQDQINGLHNLQQQIMTDQQQLLHENECLKSKVNELVDFIEFQDKKFDQVYQEKEQIKRQLYQLRETFLLFDEIKEDDHEDKHFFRHLLKRDYTRS